MDENPETLTCCQCGRPFQPVDEEGQRIVCAACAPAYFNPVEDAAEREFSRRFLAHTRAEMAFLAEVEAARALPQPMLTEAEKAALREASQEAMAQFRAMRRDDETQK